MENHIKIHGIIPRIQYVANGENTTFEFPFAIFKDDNLEVYIDETLQNSNSYTVSGAGETEGGSITFLSAPAEGSVVTLFRNLSIERTTDFQEGGALRANALNYELDYQIACQQQIADNMNRAMTFPPYATNIDVDLTLPMPSAGKAIVWNADGTNLENSTVAVNALESTLNGYKTAAETAAATATQKAGIASDKADIATSKAEEATATLASKLSKDVDNLSAAGKKVVANLSFPSSTYVDLTLNVTNSEYTAPANGYYYICKGAISKQFIDIRNLTADYRKTMLSSNDNQCLVIMPVQKNDVIKINYTATGNLEAFRFIYAEGEV